MHFYDLYIIFGCQLGWGLPQQPDQGKYRHQQVIANDGCTCNHSDLPGQLQGGFQLRDLGRQGNTGPGQEHRGYQGRQHADAGLQQEDAIELSAGNAQQAIDRHQAQPLVDTATAQKIQHHHTQGHDGDGDDGTPVGPQGSRCLVLRILFGIGIGDGHPDLAIRLRRGLFCQVSTHGGLIGAPDVDLLLVAVADHLLQRSVGDNDLGRQALLTQVGNGQLLVGLIAKGMLQPVLPDLAGRGQVDNTLIVLQLVQVEFTDGIIGLRLHIQHLVGIG